MFLKHAKRRVALLPLRDGVILTIRKLDDERVGVARFCLVDDSNTPFKDPYTNRNTWSRAALNQILGRNDWKPDKTKVRFSTEGYKIHAEPINNALP